MKFTLEKVRIEKREIPDSIVMLELPSVPPSTNNLYFNIPSGGRAKSQQYRDWIKKSLGALTGQVTGRLIGRVDIHLRLEDCHPTRDVDNTIKPLVDLLKESGAILNDNSKHVRSVKAEWAPIKGVTIQIQRCAA